MNYSKTAVGIAAMVAAFVFVGCYKITGGGQFVIDNGAISSSDGEIIKNLAGDQCTFTFSGQPVESDSKDDLVPAKGQIQVVNHTSNIIFHGKITETGHEQWRSLDPDTAVYWGEAQVRMGNGGFLPAFFQLDVTTHADGSTTAFLGVVMEGFTQMVFSATLEDGNVTAHVE